MEGYNDISPRMGAVYDLFGTGKTALKFNTGRYLEAAVNDNGNYSELLPASRVDTSTNRTWTDNGNFNPDCDFLNPAVQDNRATGGDLCGQITEDGFGKSVPQVFYDPQIMKGWGVRPADWQIGVTVQHEVLPRISVEVGYSRRWLQNFTVTDNLARAVSDHTQFSVTAPLDPRLPGGGGYVVSNLFDPNQNVATLTNNFNTYAPNYGKQYSIYNGLELNLSARLRNGVQFQVGSSTGETVTDNCEIRAQLPEINLLNPYCHNAPGITTQSDGRRVVHDSKGRRPGQRDLPEQSWRSAGGELDHSQRHRATVAGPRSLQSGAEHHRESARAGADARRAGQSDRLPRR